jgi:DNA-binding IclR family transcriptional regulator
MAKKTAPATRRAAAPNPPKPLDKNFIGLTAKVFSVLETLGRAGAQPVSLEDITKSVKLAKTTVHRLLYSLAKIGYVERQDDSGKYALTSRFFDIGRDALPHRHLTVLARPLMKTMVSRFGVSAHLGVLESGQVVYIAVEESQNPFRCAGVVGQCCFCHSTSIGKSMLAFLPVEEVDRIVALHGLSKMTERTITRREALDEELRRVREAGSAIDRGENIEGVICVGAPIFDHAGRVLAAISVSGPAGQMEPQLELLQREVRRISNRLSMMVGHTPGAASRASD